MSEATATIDVITTPSTDTTTSTTASGAPAGTYVWQDLFTTDTKAAQAFYGELFGWTVKPMTMPEADWTYDLLENQGEGFGGCMPLFPGMGDAPRWTPYITVPGDDVDAAVERAAAAGGTVAQPPEDIPNVGRFAIVLDPDGTATHPFAPIPPEGGVAPERSGMPPVGGISWNELWVNDLQRGRDFYATVYGWTIDKVEMGEDVEYYICNTSADAPMRGGFGSTGGRMPATAVFYVHVVDLEATAAKIAELGGTTEGPVMDVPETGRMQWARDPQGAQFCLHQEVT